MSHKSFFVLLFISISLCSFSVKKENTNLTLINSKSAKSFVEASDYLKLKINSPKILAEYSVDENNKSGLIKSANKEIIFIPNNGQIIDTDGNLRPDILYKAFLNGIDLYLTKKGMSFVFYKCEDKPQNIAAGKKEINEELHSFIDDPMKDKVVKMYRMDLDFIGMNSNFSTLNEEQTQEYFNYYYAHCPEGITNVYGYRKVIYKNVYNNIDIVFHSNEKGLKYDFILKPGGDLSDIKIKYRNEDEMYITKEGKIKALNPFGEIETDVLYTYQSDGKVIESYYKKDTDGMINIQTSEYDRTKNLIIDPYIGATYYGGNHIDLGESIDTDNENSILLSGSTHSTNFPIQNYGVKSYYQDSIGNISFWNDAFIIKFNSNGIRLWASFYGGSNNDIGYSITTDGDNNILVTGKTNSSDFPLYNPGSGAYFQDTLSIYPDAFILKFNSIGFRLWATFYGGSNDDVGYSITTDDDNNILVTIETNSSNIPTHNPGGGAYFQGTISGSTDVFILKFNSSGFRQWATYYGGYSLELLSPNSITTDNYNNIYITGYTFSNDLPLYNPGGGAYFQSYHSGAVRYVFILKFISSGIRQWATYYGGSFIDIGCSINADLNNNILVTGRTLSTDFPVFDPGGGAYFQDTILATYNDNYDLFILKFNSMGVRLWATYYGGYYDDRGYSITTDIDNNILVTGYTSSTDFPIFNPGGGAYFQSTNAGGKDVFILKFNSYGIRQWATYYGGSSYYNNDIGKSITTDGDNNIYVTGYTDSDNFPVFNPGGGAYFQGSFGIAVDAFILGFRPSGIINIKTTSSIFPDNYKLYQNYPNPFNPTTNIRFELKKSSHTKLIIYDILGKEVATLVDEKLNAGSYEVSWPAPSRDGSVYPSGVYFYRLVTEDYINTKKMLLVK